MLFWWTLLHFGAWYDALILEDLWLMVCYTWRMMTWRFWWWRLGFGDDLVALIDDMEAFLGWRFGWWRLCYIDDLETVLILHSTGKMELATFEGWIPQTPLGWIQENTSWVLYKSWNSYFSWYWERSEKIEVFRITTTYCIKWFLSMNNDWVFHLHLVHFVYLVHLLLLCIKD